MFNFENKQNFCINLIICNYKVTALNITKHNISEALLINDLSNLHFLLKLLSLLLYLEKVQMYQKLVGALNLTEKIFRKVYYFL